MDDNTVSDHTTGLFVEDTAWQQMKLVLDAIHDDSVPCIGSTSYSGANIIFLVEQKVYIISQSRSIDK